MRYPGYEGLGQVAWEPGGLWAFWQVGLPNGETHLWACLLSSASCFGGELLWCDLKPQDTDGQLCQHAT